MNGSSSFSQASENGRLQEILSTQKTQITEAQQALETSEQGYHNEKLKTASLEDTLRAVERHVHDVQQHSAAEIQRIQVNHITIYIQGG